MSTIAKISLKKIILGAGLILLVPLISIVMRVIFIYGNYIGTQARVIMEEEICK